MDRASGLTATTAAATYAAQSNVYTKTEAYATNSTITAVIAQANTNIANLTSGSASLETLNVFNELVGGANTLEIKLN